MKITDLLKPNGIKLNVEVDSKQSAIALLADLQYEQGYILNKEEYTEGILAREAQGTTAVGNGIAIPHCKSDSVKTAGLAVITVKDGIDYGAPDGSPTKLIFMIAAPKDGDLHLEVLAKLMQMLMDHDFCQALLDAKTPEEFLSIIESREQNKEKDVKHNGYRVLAVTACPTGIAHTYMAAEALEKAGEVLGYSVKAETNGSGGAKNVLTEKEIESADGIIIAADKTVEMSRFDGKPVVSVKVSEAIHHPEMLIKRVVEGDAPIHRHAGPKNSQQTSAEESFGRRVYKHLMNGVSHMLPFVVAGGIFIALAFLIDTVSGAPQDSGFGTNTPLAAFFKTIGGVAFGLLIPILSGYIAMSIADRPGLLVGLVGGFLAVSGATFSSPSGDVSSGFLGGLLAGFAGGYLMRALERACDKLPHALEGIKSVLLYPLAGLGIIAVIMCAVNPFMGMINTGMTNALNDMAQTEGLMIPLCALLAGMMAIDMGGPFNKAAYVFATVTLESGTQAAYMIMAAVMVGGMVPPLVIALCSTFFKRKWHDDERKNALVNYVMGLSFITEGAIPFAAAYPLQVIPSCVIGSAVAGALSALFGCTLMAPHGGVFVFAVVGNWYWYLLSLAAGSVVGMFILALLKRSIHARERV